MATIDDIAGLLKGAGLDPRQSNGIVEAFRLAVEGNTITINATFDGQGAALTAGTVAHVRVPVACTITEATALADQSGSVVVDVWSDTYANYPPTNADSITASAPITISSATKSTDSTLAGWDKTIGAGDVVSFNVDSCASITRLNITLKATRT